MNERPVPPETAESAEPERAPNRLYEAVCEAVNGAGRVDASNIDIELRPLSEEVVLRGTVPDGEQRRLAEEFVLAVEGVTQVDNRLAVAGSSA